MLRCSLRTPEIGDTPNVPLESERGESGVALACNSETGKTIELGATALEDKLKAFMQVAGEAEARGAVRDVVKRLLPPGALVSQQVEVGRERVAVRLVSTRVVSAEKIHEAEREIERRSGRKAIFSVASIASQSELAELMGRLTAPPEPAPDAPMKSLEDIHQEVIDRIKPILSDV